MLLSAVVHVCLYRRAWLFSVEYNFANFAYFWYIAKFLHIAYHCKFFCLVQFDLAVGSVHEVCTLRKKTGPMEIHFCVVSQTDVAESQYGGLDVLSGRRQLATGGVVQVNTLSEVAMSISEGT